MSLFCDFKTFVNKYLIFYIIDLLKLWCNLLPGILQVFYIFT